MGASQVPWSCEAEALLTLPRNTAGTALRAQAMLIRLQRRCIDPSGLLRVGSGSNPCQRPLARGRDSRLGERPLTWWSMPGGA